MSVRRFGLFTQWFKSTHGATIDYALVDKKHAGENAPAAPHGPERLPARAATTQDLNTLCVDGSGLNVCPWSQSHISVTGRTAVGASGREEECSSQSADQTQMSATPQSNHKHKSRLARGDKHARTDRCQFATNHLTEEVAA